MKTSKKRSITVGAAAALLVIAPVIVLAVVYQSGMRQNRFQPASVHIGIVENSGSPADSAVQEIRFRADESSNSYIAKKQVAVYDNRDSSNAYLRVRFVPMWYDGDGFICAAMGSFTDFQTQTLDTTNDQLLLQNGKGETVITLQLAAGWRDAWTYEPDDGCFYYGGTIEPNRTTPLLLDEVVLSKAMYDASEGYTLRLEVLADAVQTYGGAKEIRWESSTADVTTAP